MEDHAINILLIEADDAQREQIEQAFTHYPKQVTFSRASTLQEARTQLVRSSPDLVIANLILPDGKATELLPSGDEERRFPVVLVTAHNGERVAMDALTTGAVDFVVRSSGGFSELPRVVDQALRQWQDLSDCRRSARESRKARQDLEDRIEKQSAELVATNALLQKEVAERKQVEQYLEKERQRLEQLQLAQERDRKLIAYEIHDGLAQQLTAAIMKFDAFRQMYQPESEHARATFTEGFQLLKDCLAETRRLISGLRPPVLDDSGLVAAIEYLIEEHRDDTGPEIEFAHDVQFERLTPVLETALFRIIQESLTNACRHSGSDKIQVRLTRKNNRVRVEVQDWGRGFEKNTVKKGHFGLQSIYERAKLLDGHAAIKTAPGKGTLVTAELPA